MMNKGGGSCPGCSRELPRHCNAVDRVFSLLCD